jgi:hypothetical protein
LAARNESKQLEIAALPAIVGPGLHVIGNGQRAFQPYVPLAAGY